MEMRVRPASGADLGFVHSCAKAAYGPYEAEIGVRPAPLDADYRVLVDAGRVHLIELSGAPMGFIVLKPDNTPAPDDGTRALLIENVAVMPDAQGKGIGRHLLTFAEAHAQSLGIHNLALYTHERMTRNIELYLKLGYDISERRREDGFDRVYMHKTVGSAV